MKKFFAILLVALFGAVPLFANDADDVKATIFEVAEKILREDYSGILELYAPDYQEKSPNGKTADYEQIKLSLLAIDGKHPEEFFTIGIMSTQNVDLTEDMKAKIHEVAQSPEGISEYKKGLRIVHQLVKIKSGIELKTTKFINIYINGDNATAVYEYLSIDKDNNVRDTVSTTSLRRVNGRWLIYRDVTEYK